MNPPSAAPQPPAERAAPDIGWGCRRWFFVLLIAIAAHLALVVLFGSKKTPTSRTADRVPQLHLAGGNAELISLSDPTLFVVPHDELDFFPAEWRRPPPVVEPYFNWTEAPPFLAPVKETLGGDFATFMQTNRIPEPPLSFKPEPGLAVPEWALAPLLPQHSTMELSADIASRLLDWPDLPPIKRNDVLKPGRVQVLVDANGVVASAVLLESSDWETADKNALEIARKLRFKPGKEIAFGTVTFNWHTVPVPTP
jgi:TonB family protein